MNANSPQIAAKEVKAQWLRQFLRFRNEAEWKLAALVLCSNLTNGCNFQLQETVMKWQEM